MRLVGLLVVVVIIIVLYATIVGRQTGAGSGTGGGTTVYKAAINKASGVECQSNLRQIRSAIQMYEQTNERKPQNLNQLSAGGVTGAMLSCPVIKRGYLYNPAMGIVKCPAREHANF